MNLYNPDPSKWVRGHLPAEAAFKCLRQTPSSQLHVILETPKSSTAMMTDVSGLLGNARQAWH